MPEKKLKVDIFTRNIDVNAWAILGAFKKQARKEGWTSEEIETVLNKARNGNYDHLIQTLMKHID